MSTSAGAFEGGALAVLRIGGADARAFLQGQLSSDLRLVTRDNTQLAAVNTPQGRVVSLLRVFERSDAICAILPRSILGVTVERLRKYVLRSKVSLAPADDLAVEPLTGTAARLLGAQPAPEAAPCSAVHREADDVSRLLYLDSVPRALVIGMRSAVDQHLQQAGARAGSWNDWRLAQIMAGEPQVYPATSEHFVAQMLNLDLIGGLSFTKGCYTGQEIIVRTQHLGRIKRRMLRARHAAADSAPGDKVLDGGASVGEVVDRATAPDGPVEFLAVMQLAQAQAPQAQLRLGSSVVASLELPYRVVS
jgi:folate-binding protein YgfZ